MLLEENNQWLVWRAKVAAGLGVLGRWRHAGGFLAIAAVAYGILLLLDRFTFGRDLVFTGSLIDLIPGGRFFYGLVKLAFWALVILRIMQEIVSRFPKQQDER